jgi:pimeloyl-ACP methyl ester carboxylesterase
MAPTTTVLDRTVTIATADAGPLDVHVLEAGSGPPVLMLHGWPEHAGCWRDVMPLLADRYRVICPDLRGFGASGTPGRGYDGETFAADQVALLDALELEQAHVVGHDWGGFAAFVLALRHPERVERMLLLNTAPPWIAPSLQLASELWRTWYVWAIAFGGGQLLRHRPEQLARLVRRGVVHPEGFTEADARAYMERLREPERARASMLVYRSYLRAFVEIPLRRRYEPLRLRTRTHFLFGTADAFISTAYLRDLDRHCDDLTLELVPDSGHFIAEEKPALVAQRAAELFGA